MKHGRILSKAWDLTLSSPKIKWFAFVPAFMGVLFFVAEVAWQLEMYSKAFELNISLKKLGLDGVLDFVVRNELIGWTVLLVVLVILFQYVLSPWVQGTLILAVDEKLKDPGKQYYSMRKNMMGGFKYFFKLMEFEGIRTLFSTASVWLFFLTFYRFYHDTLFQFTWPVLVVYAILALIALVFTFFAHQFIILENMGVIQAMKRSVSLVFINLSSMMAMVFLMFLVHIRILINVLTVLGVPFILGFLLSSFDSSVATALTLVGTLAMLLLSSYLSAILDVYTTAVWTETFYKFREIEDFYA